MGNHRGTEDTECTEKGVRFDCSDLTGEVIGAAINVHRVLGPGLLESVYRACLERELQERRIPCRREVEVPIVYRGLRLRCAYRLDLLVADRLVVELKAVDAILPIHHAQLLSYLRLTGHRLGLLMNFNSPILSRGIKRLVND